MKIEELEIGQSVTFEARIGEERLKFDTVVQETFPKKHMICVDVIRKNDKIITFQGKGLIVDLNVAPPESAPLLFKNVSIALCKKRDDTYCYTVSTIAEAKVINRRQSFRCFVGHASAVQCGVNRSAYDGIIRDISATGFSVIVTGDTIFHENQVLHTVLNDYIEELAENFSFQLYGIIVRVVEQENSRILYGCKLIKRVPGLESYIMKKERIRLKRNGGSNAQ